MESLTVGLTQAVQHKLVVRNIFALRSVQHHDVCGKHFSLSPRVMLAVICDHPAFHVHGFFFNLPLDVFAKNRTFCLSISLLYELAANIVSVCF